MDIKAFPGYENHLYGYLNDGSEQTAKRKQAQGQAMMAFDLPDAMTMEDRFIPGPQEGQELKIRLFKAANLADQVPIILDIHGGAFVAGSVDIDNGRCIALASRLQALVVSVDYRLCGPTGFKFPDPLLDCHAAYMYLHDHAAELGGDPARMGLHGSSAGATLAEGLALYLRDHNQPAPALTVLNCPTLDLSIEESYSYQQYYQLRMGPANKALGAEPAYLGGYDGSQPSYYAFPNLCRDLGGLGATMIIAAEYDTLRDSGIDYAQRLLRAGVPCELFVAPRLGHCFTAAPHPYTDLTHDLIAWSFKREFGQLDDLEKKLEEGDDL